ncbi:hypothetical protein [Actinomyces faecalis]|uniref:hypothetical protein n=1 Tax=Actinomyces faecalis TaxID=2722820 RepID=UPI0015567327|nr:hypothetical protein [Actinomyces faecalis]
MKRTYLDIELADGSVHEAVRVVAADKVRAAQIARRNDVPLTDGPEVAELLAYAATTRTGIVAAEDLEAWRAQVTDYAASETDPDDTADPTSAPLAAPSMP